MKCGMQIFSRKTGVNTGWEKKGDLELKLQKERNITLFSSFLNSG